MRLRHTQQSILLGDNPEDVWYNAVTQTWAATPPFVQLLIRNHEANDPGEAKPEKNVQVTQMRNIYRLAQRVLFWLREDDDGATSGAFKMLQALYMMTRLHPGAIMAGAGLALQAQQRSSQGQRCW
ncbi:hypothetical protein BJ170DRAFT_685621 [Xylariales sp. AK1849]|nr:hypothetical protein BJ170DRAFT_685621 [Xylariales sp. AK1849]